MSKYSERDAARETGTPERKVVETWHQARDDASVRGNRQGDRPTRENREDAKRLTRKIIERGREREEGESRSRDDR